MNHGPSNYLHKMILFIQGAELEIKRFFLQQALVL